MQYNYTHTTFFVAFEKSFRRHKPPKNYREDFIMTTFSKILDNEVRALANACMTEPKFIRLINPNESYELSKENLKYLKSISEKYKDLQATYSISE